MRGGAGGADEKKDNSYNKLTNSIARDSKSQRQEREQLYGAYNSLHKLAQVWDSIMISNYLT